MKNKIIKIGIAVFSVFSILSINAQDSNSLQILSLQSAIDTTLINNYGIKIAKNNVAIAENNADVLNSNLLPTVNLSANATYSNANTTNEFATGEFQDINGAQAFNYDATIGAVYTIFRGAGNYNEFKQFKQRYELSELEARLSIESTLINLFDTYFSAAKFSEDLIAQEEILAISKERYKRALVANEYGTGTKLDVLNAEVDMNTDSLSLINLKQQLQNTLRNVNLIMGVDIARVISIDTVVSFNKNLKSEDLVESAKAYNASLLQVNKVITINELGKKTASSTWYPKVDLVANYGYRGTNAEAGFLIASTNLGFTGGLKLTWSVFDGGNTSIRNQNAKIEIESSRVQKKQTEQELIRDMYNLFTTYQNDLFVMEIEQKNVKTNELNIQNSIEKYQLGQISNTQFRNAQLNLLLAKKRYNAAKYETKVIEMRLYQLAGILLQ